MIFIILVLLGLCFGSFVNAAVWRIHEQQSTKPKHNNLSVVAGRSMCPNCSHVLSTLDLMPVLSWVGLRGKCRYCHKKISWQYPMVEIATTVLFVLSYVYWPFNFDSLGMLQFSLWLVFLIGFMVIFVYDTKWMIIPNRVIYPLIVLGIVYVLLSTIANGSFDPIIQALYGVIIASGLFYGLFQLSGGKWIGGGDVKLGFAIGLIIGGATQAVLVLFIASLLGCFVSIPLLISGQGRKKKVPFGPFLIIATLVVMLFGASISTWYQNNILLL